MSRRMRSSIEAVAALTGLLLFMLPGVSQAVPSYARQGNIPCAACHTAFPALTAYGRQFKLNGYVGNAGEVLQGKEEGSKKGEEENVLTLGKVPPISVMMLNSWSSTHRMDPAAEHNGDLLLPDQFSFFMAGQLSPKAGAFIQITYSAVDDHFSWDNTDIRAADHTSLFGQDFLYGVSLNNNPTVQDVWNSTPAWGYPYAASAHAVSPTAATLIDGGLGQQVAGVSLYSLWNNLLYTEIGIYHAAPIGVTRPLTGSCAPGTCIEASNVVEGAAPYWRVALQKQMGEHYLMVGAYGLSAELIPGNGTPLSGPVNGFTDVAMDLQYEKPFGASQLTVHSTLIHERQTWKDGSTANLNDKLNVFRLDGTYLFDRHHYGATLGYFKTTGTVDAGLYPNTGDIYGSANGSPDSRGAIVELAWLPWLNTKFGAQYTAYTLFNGGNKNYDGMGMNRTASDNNTTFIYAWLIF